LPATPCDGAAEKLSRIVETELDSTLLDDFSLETAT